MSDQSEGGVNDIRETTTTKSMDQLMHQNDYTPAELSKLLNLPLTLIEHDAYAEKLKAYIVDHNILSIRRDDALAWMNNRG